MCSNLFINEWIQRVVLSQNCPVETPRASGPHQAPLECGSHLRWTQMEVARLRASHSEGLGHEPSPETVALLRFSLWTLILLRDWKRTFLLENVQYPFPSAACDATDAEQFRCRLPLSSLSEPPVCWPRRNVVTGLWYEIATFLFSPAKDGCSRSLREVAFETPPKCWRTGQS